MGLAGYGSVSHGLAEGVDLRHPASFEGQATPRLPPGCKPVQPTGLWGDEPPPDLRAGEPCRVRLPPPLGPQRIGAPSPRAGGRGLHDLLQEGHAAGAVPPRAARRRVGSACKAMGVNAAEPGPAPEGREADLAGPGAAALGPRHQPLGGGVRVGQAGEGWRFLSCQQADLDRQEMPSKSSGEGGSHHFGKRPLSSALALL